MRKRTVQPTFASLTESELEQLACDLQRETFAAVLARVRKPRSEGGLGLDLKSKTPLERLADKKNDLDLLNGILISRGQNKLTLAEYLSMSSGTLTALTADPSAIHPSSGCITTRVAAIHDAIITATHIRVTESDNSPHELLSLQRLADFPARVETRHDRAQLNREKFTHKLDMDNFRKHIATERLALAQKSFHLRQAITQARLQSLDPYDPSFNQWWGEGAPEPTSTSRTDIGTTTAAPADPNPSNELPPFPPVQNSIAQPSANSTPFNQNPGRGTFHPCPTSTSRAETSLAHATPSDPNPLNELPPFPPVQNPTSALSTIPNSLSNSPTQHPSFNTQHLASSPSPFPPFPPVQNPFPSSLPPEVLANNALYEHKVSIGEIKEISVPGELARVDYSNPGDREFFSTRERSGTARFVPDLNRTTWLPPLRPFGPSSFPRPLGGEGQGEGVTSLPPNTAPADPSPFPLPVAGEGFKTMKL